LADVFWCFFTLGHPNAHSGHPKVHFGIYLGGFCQADSLSISQQIVLKYWRKLFQPRKTTH